MSRQPKIETGHEEPFAVQFSIFLANRVRQLRELLSILNRNEAHLVGLSIVDATDWAVVRAVFSDPGKTRDILAANSLPFTESQVLLVVLVDDDALDGVCQHLLGAEINVHFAFPLTIRRQDHPVMAFHVDDWVLATHVLIRHHYTLLGSEDLGDPTGRA